MYLSVFGKLKSGTLGGRLDVPVSDKTSQIGEFSPVLNYILESLGQDERPYLRVSIYDIELLGLLDSGASSTIVGGPGWEILKKLNLSLHPAAKSHCTVANGDQCSILGYISVPIEVCERIVLIDVLVVPSLSHSLILGADFWRKIGIVPNLRSKEWNFLPDVSSIEDTAQTELTEDQRAQLNDMLKTVFNKDPSEIGLTSLVEHSIKLIDDTPIKQRYYPVSPPVQKQINNELDRMLKDDIVEPSDSPWSSPIILVKKSDGTYRFCVDYRRLNRVTVKDAYPLPRITSILDKLRGANYLSTIDIKSAFWNIPMGESSKKYTAFTVPGRGLFHFKRLPFGLCNSPATWQRFIERIITGELTEFAFPYLDDIVVVSETFADHIRILRLILNKLLDAGLSLNLSKCEFCKPEINYLGYVVDKNGLRADPQKVLPIVNISRPSSVKEIRSFMGMVSWYRRFLPNFAHISAPLNRLLRKNQPFAWSQDCENAFNNIKQALISAPILSCPNFDIPFVVQCDASGYGLGGVLTQRYPDGDRVVAYASRSLTSNERNYTTTELECLAILFSLEKFRPYIEGTRVTVITDHSSLLWLHNLKDPRGRLARWAVALTQYDFDIVHRPGRENVVPDFLSRSVDGVCVVDDKAGNSRPVDKWYTGMISRVKSAPEKYSNWKIVNDLLYKYCKLEYPDLVYDDQEYWKKVVSKPDRKKIIASYHDDVKSGHLGVNKTVGKILKDFYWPKMKADVSSYIRTCLVCNRYKTVQKAPAGFMLTRNYVNKPWELVSADIIGPLPRSSRGYRFIFVVCDYFSKFPLLFPLRSTTTDKIIECLEDHVFMMFGVPKFLVLDNGPQFRSNRFRQFASSYGVEIKFTARYHPQANHTESVNKVIKKIISCYVNENHRNWDKYLQKAACAIRSSPHDTIKHSPYFVNFGSEMHLSGESHCVTSESGGIPDVGVPEKLPSRVEGFRKLYGDIRSYMDRAYLHRSKYYNMRRRDVTYSVGQYVYRKNYVLSDALQYYTAKFAPKYLGPFKIKKKFSPWTYELCDSKDGYQGTWNAKDLKPAVEASEDT